MTDIHVSHVRQGIPNLEFKNSGVFREGRKTALKIQEAGPGHHAVASFDANETTRISTFVSGARYVTRQNPNVVVKRRKVDKATVLIYIVHEIPKPDSSF